MSTLAWDGKTLAADRQGTQGDLKRLVSKIRKLPTGEILGVTGSMAKAEIMMRWYENGGDIVAYPKFQESKDDWCRLVVVKPDGEILEFESDPIAIPFFDVGFTAWGSGRDFALGALRMGATAPEAIVVASEFDINTGMGLEFFTLGEENG